MTKRKRKRNRQKSGQNDDDNSNNNKSNNESESGAQWAQNHSHVTCHCCGEKGHCASDCPMKDKTAKMIGQQRKECKWCRA